MGSSFYQDTGIDKDQVKTASQVAQEAAALAQAQATIATTEAAEAAASAGSADAAATAAAASETDAEASATAASTSETNAATSAATATAQAVIATTQAGIATTKAAEANTSAANAAASEASAALSEGNASDSETAAATSETNAAASAVAAAASAASAATDYVAKAIVDAADQVLVSTGAATVSKVQLSASTILGRGSVGAAAALTMAELKTLLALVKGDVGLGNVDNTSDANKPVSSAQQTALDLKINKSILTAADDVLVGSGASTPAVVNLTASTIFGKKAAGGASALSPSEARTVLGLATTDSPHFAGGFLDAGGILRFYHSDGTRYGEAFSDSGGFNILARSTGDDLFLGSKNGISLLGGSAGTSVRLRIDGNGSIGIGQAPPSTSAIGIHVTDASWIGRAVDTPRLDLCANLHYDGTNWRLKRTASGAAALILEGNALNGAIDFYRVAGGTAGATASLSSQLAIGSDGILPGSDNVFNLGNSGKRFTVIYATTGSINTSDARHKAWRGSLTTAELAVAKRIAGKLGMYRWLDAIAHKGDDARLHAGVLAQEVHDAFIAEGLDGFRYGLLCYDTWDEKTDPNSGEVTPAGDRYAIRYDELTCFMLAAFEARLAAAGI